MHAHLTKSAVLCMRISRKVAVCACALVQNCHFAHALMTKCAACGRSYFDDHLNLHAQMTKSAILRMRTCRKLPFCACAGD